MKFPIALQPYTIREELDKDFFGSFQRVADIGYRGVEVGMPPKGITVEEMKSRFAEMELQVISCHSSVEQLTNDLSTVTDFVKEMGGKYIVLSHRFDTKEDVLKSARLFNQIGADTKAQGIQFLYHNHDWEFTKFDDQYALDILLDETNPDLVKLELDTYWVQKGGENPAEYLRKLKNRCPLLHVKDMEADEEQFFAEVGEGILDFREIIQVAEDVGTEWLVVEQDLCRRDVFDCIETSYTNLREMGVI
ncbi:sugar phosphate isomerase/epimerase family protein [Bacillus sp. FSL K6-3431]|uniref:sugar phosphate isomerase/epimerase family protein n=1 Tax=Bacillus sp. FSL K6-3431 TaxID=2921500 RepID=UPI0030F62EDA